MAKRIKATPIKSKTLCENCQGDNYHNCSKIKDGEPCGLFKRKIAHIRLFPDRMSFCDKHGNEVVWFGEGAKMRDDV